MYKSPWQQQAAELRRLFSVKIYEGDPDKKKTKTRTETVIAFNATEAIQKASALGPVAEVPEAIDWITWDDPPLIIRDTAGPTDEVAKPTLE